MHKITFFFIICLSVIKIQAQDLSVPFKVLDGLPIVNITVNGKNHQFVFDTGASMTVINSEVFLGLPISKKFDKVGGISSERKSMNAVNFSFNFLNQNFKNKEVLYTDLSLISKMSCTNLEVSGIIGRDIIENYIVEINPDSEKLIFHDHSGFNENQLKDFTKIKLQKNRPTIPIKIGGQTRYVLFDTGRSGGLSTTDYKLDQYIETTQHTSYRSKGSTVGIHGVNNDEDLHHKIYNAEIQIGNLNLTHQTFDTSKNDFNNMGFRFAKQFISYLDLKNQKLYIKKIKQYTENINESIIGSIGFSTKFDLEMKKNIIINLSTKQNKLSLGDTLISINGETPPTDNCEISSYLKKFIGQNMKLIIQRGNKTKEIEIESV